MPKHMLHSPDKAGTSERERERESSSWWRIFGEMKLYEERFLHPNRSAKEAGEDIQSSFRETR